MNSPARSREPIIVASVPSSTPYVRHLSHPTEPDPVRRIPDPMDGEPRPDVLDPCWMRDHADEFDLVHVHVGHQGLGERDWNAIGRELRWLRKPLVVTVHQLPGPGRRRRQFRALLRQASKIATLTDHAARLIEQRHHRRAAVIPHPHVVELGELRRRQHHARPSSDVVGIRFGPPPPRAVTTDLVDAVLAAVRRVGGTRVRVDVHRGVSDPASGWHDEALMRRLRRLEAEGALRLEIEDDPGDEAFVERLASLRASVLPYRDGTHSTWLEACRDLGVAVVAPDCGAYRAQAEVLSFCCNRSDGFDPSTCTDAVERALREPRPDPVPWTQRRDERCAISARHVELYRDALDRARAAGGAGAAQSVATLARQRTVRSPSS